MRILLLCGESTLAPLLARQLIIRAPYYRVTTVVEKAAQRKPFKKMTEKFGPGTCKLLVNNLKGITCERDARLIVEKARAEWVVWVSGKKKNYAKERDNFERFIRASASLHHVNTFLLISSIYSRRRPAPWWKEAVLTGKKRLLHDENVVKLTMDECVTAMARMHRLKTFRGIVLRTGELTDKKEGKVALGRTEPIGSVSKNDVAEIAANLLDNAVTSAWLDLVEGDEKTGDAVANAVHKAVDCIAGEDVDAIMRKYTSDSITRRRLGLRPMDKPEKPTEMELRPTDNPEKPTEMELRPTDKPEKPTKMEMRPTNKPEKPTEMELRPTDKPKKPTEREKRPKNKPKPFRAKIKKKKKTYGAMN